jgi:hypothetical protein
MFVLTNLILMLCLDFAQYSIAQWVERSRNSCHAANIGSLERYLLLWGLSLNGTRWHCFGTTRLYLTGANSRNSVLAHRLPIAPNHISDMASGQSTLIL